MQCGRHVWNIEMSCLNIPTCYLQPQTRYEHQCLIHTSPSPLWGMWANVNLPQMPRQWIQRWKPDDTDSTTATRIQAHQYGFDNHDTSSTTPQVGTSQRRKPDDADLTTTWIWQQHGFDNDDADSTTTIQVRQRQRSDDNDVDRGMWAGSFLLNGEKYGIDWREGNYSSGGTSRIHFALSSLLTTHLEHPQ